MPRGKRTLKEGDIIQALKKCLPEGQLVRFNPGPMSPRGISDVLITWNGREWFCEIKVNRAPITELQREFLSHRSHPVLMHIDTTRRHLTCKVWQMADVADGLNIIILRLQQVLVDSGHGQFKAIFKTADFRTGCVWLD